MLWRRTWPLASILLGCASSDPSGGAAPVTDGDGGPTTSAEAGSGTHACLDFESRSPELPGDWVGISEEGHGECFDDCGPPPAEGGEPLLLAERPARLVTLGNRAYTTTPSFTVLGLDDPAEPTVLAIEPEVEAASRLLAVDGGAVSLIAPSGRPTRTELVRYAVLPSGEVVSRDVLSFDGRPFGAELDGGVLLLEVQDDATKLLRLVSVDVSSSPPAVLATLDVPHHADEAVHHRAATAVEGQHLYVMQPRMTPDGIATTIQVVERASLQPTGAELTVPHFIGSPDQIGVHEGALAVVSGLAPQGSFSTEPIRVQTYDAITLAPLGALDVPTGDVTNGVAVHEGRVFIADATFTPTRELVIVDVAGGVPVEVARVPSPSWPKLHPVAAGLLVTGSSEPTGAAPVQLLDTTAAVPSIIATLDALGRPWDDDVMPVQDGSQIVLQHDGPWSGDYCGPIRTAASLVNVSSAGLEVLGTVDAAGDLQAGSVGGRLLVSSGGVIASLSPDAFGPSDVLSSSSATAISAHVSSITPSDHGLVRIGGRAPSYGGGRPGIELDVVPSSLATAPSTSTVTVTTIDGEAFCEPSSTREIFTQGDHAFLVVYEVAREDEMSRQSIVSVSLADDGGPRILTSVELPEANRDGSNNLQTVGFTGEAVVAVDFTETEVFVSWVDVRDPEALAAHTLDLSASPNGGANSRVDGTVLAVTHAEVREDGSWVHYLDRVDFGDVAAPDVLPRVTVPGDLVAYDAAAERGLFSAWEHEVAEADGPEACRSRLGNDAYFDAETSSCTRLETALVVVDLSGEAACIVTKQSIENGARLVEASRWGGVLVNPASNRSALLSWGETIAITDVDGPDVEGFAGLFGTHAVFTGDGTVISYDLTAPNAEPTMTEVPEADGGRLPIVVVGDGTASIEAPTFVVFELPEE